MECKPDPYITYCAKCKKELRLLKDSTENKLVYCGMCYAKVKGGK